MVVPILLVVIVIIITSVIMMKSVISTEHLGVPEFNPFMDVGTSKVHLTARVKITGTSFGGRLDWQVMII